MDDIFAFELNQTVVQRAASIHGIIDPSIHIDVVPANLDNTLTEAVSMPRYKILIGSAPSVDQPPEGDPAIDISITQIAHPSLIVSINAISSIENLLKYSADKSWLELRVDQILIGCTMQIRMLHQCQVRSLKDIIQGYKALLLLLHALFVQPNLAQRASKDVLKDLIHLSLHVMLDDRLIKEEQGDQVVRALNVLVLKMIENTEHTAMISALLRLFHDAVGRNSNSKYVELVMKCLWCIIKNLNEWISTINVSAILVDIHLFLKAYPSPMWKERQPENLIRTIKTLIHALVRVLGEPILSQLGRIDNLKESELESYLHKLLVNGVGKDVDVAKKGPSD